MDKEASALSVFLIGDSPEVISRDKTAQNAQTNMILKRYGIGRAQKHLVRKDKDILQINNHDADCFVIFPYTLQRFAPLIHLAETGKPVTIVSEENTFLYALETFDYLSDHENVQLAFSPKEVQARIKAARKKRWFRDTKICLFDAGEWKLNGIAWQRNPLFSGTLNVETVDTRSFLGSYKNVGESEAEKVARTWVKESKVSEPSFEDITKCARIYLAMKAVLKKAGANAAYVLWCGQFTKPLEAKMCFALAKLADEGFLVGCWRGGNLLPMLILNEASKKPVFTPEALSHKRKTITLRHCFAPSSIGSCRYNLRNWRTMKGTVTGYCKLPRGTVTLVNCGVGDKIVVAKGEVVDCRDLEGDNCRITIWIEVEDEALIHKFVGREFALVYGDCKEKSKQIGEKLGLKVL